MKRFAILFLFIALFFLLPAPGFAQVDPVDPCDDPLNPDICQCDPTNPICPIDGGVSLLIAAGIGIGAKKAYNERKKATANKAKDF